MIGGELDGSPDLIFQMADSVAVIPIRVTLVQRNGLDPYSGMTGYDGLARKLEAAEADPDVRGIVFDIDSPSQDRFSEADQRGVEQLCATYCEIQADRDVFADVGVAVCVQVLLFVEEAVVLSTSAVQARGG